jgi:hypothetical protein
LLWREEESRLGEYIHLTSRGYLEVELKILQKFKFCRKIALLISPWF